MKNTFTKKLETLQQEAINTLIDLINTVGVKSDHISDKCLKIKSDDLMFNLEGGRYLTEVFKERNTITLVDNSGYHYNFRVLEDEQFMQVVDHFVEEYSEEEEVYILGEDKINGIALNEKIRQEELHEYYITHRESFLEELMRWISEATNDKALMKADLKELMSVKDEYIFSSNSTNSYLYIGCAEFSSTCEEILEINKTL